jgi:hypothetical protein
MGQEYVGGIAFDQAIRVLAERIYGRYRARDVVRSQAEVEVLISNLKRAVMVWAGAGCNALAATAGWSGPAGLADASPVTFVAGAGAPYNMNL